MNDLTAATFFVATDGNDAWSGKAAEPNAAKTDGPFASLRRARDAVRELKAAQEGLTEPVTVVVRGGKYYLESPFDLSSADSGTAEAPVTYRAYPGETPVLSGGRRITEWEPHQGNILKCGIPETKGGAWSFRQLFLNGRRMVRARYPNLDLEDPCWNGTWAHSEADAAALEATNPYIVWKEPGAFPHTWAKPSQGELFLMPSEPLWGDSCMIRIQSVDRDKGIIRLVHGMRDFDTNPMYFTKELRRPDRCRFVVENLLEELDQPGEWCLDGEDGVLYFWPPAPNEVEASADGLADSEVVVPVLKCLVHMTGTAHLGLSGFVFTETVAGEPSSHYADVEGVGAMRPQQGWEYCGETIYMNRCSHCRIENNTITAIGGNGIYMRHHNEMNLIRGNEISDAGANGIVLAGGRHSIYEGEAFMSTNVGVAHPTFNEVSDNVVHHCGLYDTYAAGVFLGLGNWNRVVHNLIHDLPHHGINLGNSRYGRQYVEYNRIHRTCLVTSDSGAINCWNELPVEDESPGHVIRYNLVTDTGNPRSHTTKGIYLDNWASQCLVQGNIVVNTSPGGQGFSILVKGRNNIIENNILVNAGQRHICMRVHPRSIGGCSYPEFTTVITRNILCDLSGRMDAFFEVADSEHLWQVVAESDRNLFFKAGADNPVIARVVPLSDSFHELYGIPERAAWLQMPEWRRAYGRDEEVYDVLSIVADPLFVDAANGDYRLQATSPAHGLGFQPIDIAAIGPRQ
ncbi:MAG: right-handed parallel beta-helix repeat-containing protein [Kiritimatiellia bacterium]|nr:right-handed parallel beta-helix repeat-containing protein [Kiritimatiellia bacterium]